MADLAQRPGELDQALRRPPQRRLGIPARDRIDQPLEIREQRRIVLGQRLAAPPGRRTRPGSTRSPDSSSASPRRTVSSEIPVARTTAPTPPGPCELASAAAHNRRRRSSNSGANNRHRSAILACANRAAKSPNLDGSSLTPPGLPPDPKTLHITPTKHRT
jgi:hypothetical protein